ncbi:hypothetical protein PM082_016561 [Marasmius tenuissimus]|nr:hypothetical protein PM082_016561 [Marasmius tenuissimus]
MLALNHCSIRFMCSIREYLCRRQVDIGSEPEVVDLSSKRRKPRVVLTKTLMRLREGLYFVANILLAVCAASTGVFAINGTCDLYWASYPPCS